MTSWPNYCNDAKVWLPMTSAAHDAGNNRTLDVSGNGLHYRFGDGSTAGTFPTKLSGQRGYSFDGSDDYLEALENQTNAITEGTWAVFVSHRLVNNTFYMMGHLDATTTRGMLISTTNSIRFYCGDLTNFSTLAMAPHLGQAVLCAGVRRTSGVRQVYYNGLLGSLNSTGTSTPSTAVSSTPKLGSNSSGTQNLPGRIFWYGHWEYALTELQLRDLEARLRREYNNV